MEAPSDEYVGLAVERTVPDAPRPGQVLAERYEVVRPFGEGPLTVDLLALDQERELQVLLRVVRSEGFGSAGEGRETLRRLRALVGAGGRFLAPLLDADREGAFLFAVEPVPRGVAFRDVLARRLSAGRRLSAEELLPVAARLQAALAAIPEGFAHGALRAEDVWVEAERLVLHGAWVGAALPPRARSVLVEMSEAPGLVVAPEVRAGVRAGPAADRFAVAALLWEAWTGRPPRLAELPPVGSDPVARALARLLRPEPAEREAELTPLLEALAEAAGLPVPELDPGAEPPRGPELMPTLPGEAAGRASAVQVRAVPGAEAGGTVELSLEEADVVGAPEPVAGARRPAGGDPTGTAEVSLDQIVEMREAAGARRPAGGDPTGTAEVSLDQIVEMREAVRARRRPSRREPTDELRLEEAEVIGAMVTSEEGGGVVGGGPAEAELPADLKPVPRPRKDSGVGIAAPPLYDEERGVVAAPPSLPREHLDATATAPPEAPRTEPPPPSRRRVSSGLVVVAVAAFVAALIVAVAFAVAAFRKAEREREREQQIRERIEQVREGSLPATPGR